MLISCMGYLTTKLYHLALDSTHAWPVLVYTVGRHRPLAGACWGLGAWQSVAQVVADGFASIGAN